MFSNLDRNIEALVKAVSVAETDSMKMRYVSNFIFKAKEHQDDAGNAVVAIENAAKNLQERDKSILSIVAFILSDRNEKFLPEALEPPLNYNIGRFESDPSLAARNIFVSKNEFAN